MKQIRLLLLAGTVMSAAALSFHPATGLAANGPMQLAQVPPPPPEGEVPPEEQKKKQQPRGEERQQKQEQRQEQKQQRGEERQQKQEQRQEQRQEQKQQRQEERQQRRPEAPPREAPPPRVEREAPPPEQREAPPPPREAAPPPADTPPPPAERKAAPPSEATPPVPPRAQERREDRREERREERREDRKQDSGPPIPPVPQRGDTPPPPAGGADAQPRQEAPSVAPEPPPAGEKAAIPPEELKGGRRTPEQRQRAEERVEREFKNRDRRMDERFERRVEERGDRTIIREGDDRVIIRDGDRTIIRNDETERLRRNADDVRTERRGRENVTVIRRPGGVEIVTVTDSDGNLIRRVRRVNGREVVLIDNSRAWERGGRWDRDRGWRDRRDRDGVFIDFYLDLPPVRVDIPRDEYIIDSEDAGYDDYYEALDAPPLVATERPYSLQEVTQNVRLRERVRSIDLNTVNFATAEWKVADDQVDKLEDLARAIKATIEEDPTQVYLIEGHTDAVGSALDNLSLSDRRAEEVAAILTEHYEIPAENLVTQGYGEDYLKVNTEAANPENRRVTIRNITGLLQAQQASAPQ